MNLKGNVTWEELEEENEGEKMQLYYYFKCINFLLCIFVIILI